MNRLIPIIVMSLAITGLAQESKNLQPGEKLQGRVKTVTWSRTYLIRKRTRVNEDRQVVGKDVFDASGKIIQTSVFGNGEERTLFEYGVHNVKTTVKYFDLQGRLAPKLAAEFSAPYEDSFQSDLCQSFGIQYERGPSENIKIEREICPDGSVRRTITSEYTPTNLLFSLLTEDAKGRTWEIRNHFNPNNQYKGFTFSVNNLRRPTYCQEIIFSEEKRDRHDNWIQSVASVSPCGEPNNLYYQYLEGREISYYDN
jgi:hypothetical protein